MELELRSMQAEAGEISVESSVRYEEIRRRAYESISDVASNQDVTRTIGSKPSANSKVDVFARADGGLRV